MLSHTVMRVVQVFPSFGMLSLACVFVRDGLPSVEMWIDPGEDDAVVWARLEWWRRFEFCQVMWLVMLESVKNRISGVDPPGQQVPPRVRYGTACLLIRYAIGCVSCSVEWGWLLSLWPVFVTFFVNYLNHMVQKGSLCAGNLSIASRATLCGNPYQSMTYSCSRPL
jgi:hypothetical protein